MQNCPNVPRCPLYKKLGQTSLATLRALYCEGVFSGCARFRSMKSGVVPEADLLPNGERLRNSLASPPRHDEK